MKRVFICSRYSGNVEENVKTAERLCRIAIKKGFAPFAPHLLFTRFLDDDIPEEREIGLSCAQIFMQVCDEVWVHKIDGRLSKGMIQEINYARDRKIPIIEIVEE